MSQTAQIILLLPVVAGALSSFVTELVTKSSASQGVKSFVFVVLAAITGALSTVAYDGTHPWTTYAEAVAIAIVSGVATHYTGATNVLQDASAHFGLGATAGRRRLVVVDQPDPFLPPDAGVVTVQDVVWVLLGIFLVLAILAYLGANLHVFH